MKSTTWLIMSITATLGLLLAACAPAAAPTPAPTIAPPAPAARTASTPTPAPVPPSPAQPTPTPKAIAPQPTAVVAPKPAGEQPRSGGVLTTFINQDWPHWDSHQETTTRTTQPVTPAYDYLVQFDPQDESKISPDLAEKWEISPDGKTYTFHLRQGVKFHDGKPLKAEDVAASFWHIAKPPKGVNSPREGLFDALDKIETPDDSTVVFRLKQPQASFLGVLALSFNLIYEKALLDKDPQAMKRQMVGTGPFKLKDFSFGVGLTLEKNPAYWMPGRPYLDGIKFYVIKDGQAAKAALVSGQVILAPTPQLEMTGKEEATLEKQIPGFARVTLPGPVFYSFTPNYQRAPFNDVRVRKALWLAADHKAAADILVDGRGVAGGLLMPGTLYATPQEEIAKWPGYRYPKDQDIAEAKRLLAEAGFPNGFETWITARSGKAWVDYAVYMTGELAKIGIKAEVRPEEIGAQKLRMFNRDFPTLVFRESQGMGDPDAFFGGFYTSTAGQNWGGYANPKVDELYVKQSQAIDPKERLKLARELEQTIIADYPRVIHFWWSMSTYLWPQVKDWKPHSSAQANWKHRDTWLSR